MKVDLKLIELMVANAAPAKLILEYLREQEVKSVARRTSDKARKREERVRKAAEKKRTDADASGQTVDDAPRARLFREGSGALLTLGIAERRGRGLIAQWLKLTSDDEQLVMATILKAQQIGAADAPGWILETLKGKTNGNRTGVKQHPAELAFDLADQTRELERKAGITR